MNNNIIIGISGASGMVYAVGLIEALSMLPGEIHLIISEVALKVFKYEQSREFDEIISSIIKTGKARIIIHDNNDLFASVASGSFNTGGMVIIPCSMKSLSAVANGYTENLIERAADVTLKERRPLILLTRETPLSLIHLNNMVKAVQAGAIVMPASPGFYHHPEKIEDIVNFMTSRVLDHLKMDYQFAVRWRGKNKRN